jgi:diguanylate cyclase (GGDEF)-like protein/PAS domain S-box-containing protein
VFEGRTFPEDLDADPPWDGPHADSLPLLAAVVQSSEDAIVTATPDARITTWNPAAERMYGYTAAEIVGKPITDLVTPDLAEAMMRVFQSVLGGKRLSNLETRSIRKDGSPIWVAVTAFPVVDGAGAVLGGTSILRDIGERRLVDKRLRRQTAAVELLQTVAVAANEASRVAVAAGDVLAAVCRSGRWLGGHVYAWPPDGTPRGEGFWHVADPLVDYLPESRAGGCAAFVAQAVADRRPLVIADVGAQAELHWLDRWPVTTLVIVPIVAGQEVFGIAELFGAGSSHADDAAVEVLAQVGGMMGRLAERERAEETLRSSDQRHRAIVQTASDAFIGMDEAGRITEWNQRAEALLGWPVADVVGRPFTDTVLPQRLRQPFDVELRQLGASGDSTALGDRRELAALHRDGHEIPVEISVWPVRTGAGLDLNAFVRDISERNRVLQLQAQLVSIVQSSDDAIVGMDPDCTITSWNPGAQALYGYPQEEVLGNSVGILLPGNSGDRVPVLQRIALGERIQNRETEARRKDGTIVPIALSASPILDATGRIIGISSIARDITQRKRDQVALADVYTKLSRSVEELQLRNSQVTQINEMGELLQSCLTVEEAYRVIAASLTGLFPHTSGALCLIGSSRNMLDAAATWGNDGSGDMPFLPESCWALRRGRVHVVAGPGTGLPCQHAGEPPPLASLCLPMMAQGESLGLLHIRCPPGVTDPPAWAIASEQLATSVAENLSLSLGNFRLRETLRNQSIRDPLTGLFNRRYAEESLEREVRRAGRKRSPIGLIAIDLDHFKRFNDRYGHETGDIVLRLLSEFLASSVREGDIACRYGGEEFLLILPDAPLDVTAHRAQEIRDGARAIKVPHPAPQGESLTVSLGVAAYPDHGFEVRQVMRVADLALYRAKAEGRDRVVVADVVEEPEGEPTPTD